MSEVNAPAAGGQGGTTSAALTEQAAPPVAASTQVTTPPAQPANTSVPWFPDADETTAGYIQNKGWDNPAKAIDSYRNLEKLLGADKAGNAVVIPKADADPKEWAAIYDRLGRPTGPDGYKVELPAGGDAKIQEAVLQKFHELGLTKDQGEKLANWYNGLGSESIAAQQAARQAAFEADDAAIKREWGTAYNQELTKAQQAARGLGLDGPAIDKLSAALGHAGTMRLLNQIGSKLGESAFVTGDKGESFGSAMTPGQAKAEIQAKMADKDFVARYRAGGMNSKEFLEMQRLQQFAYPEG